MPDGKVRPKQPAIIAGGLGKILRAGSGALASEKLYRGDGLKIAQEDLAVFRSKASKLAISSIKALLIRIEEALRDAARTRPGSEDEKAQREIVIEALLRRQSVLKSVLVNRGFHKHGDSEALAQFLGSARIQGKVFT